MADVLVVEDDPVVARCLDRDLRAQGHRVRTAGSLEAALLASVQRRADVLLLDVDLGGRPAEDLVAWFDRGIGRPRVTLLLGDRPAEELAPRADRLGVGWLAKPVDPEVLARVVRDGGQQLPAR